MSELFDELSSALGNSYRLERELGGGGMSRVFLAEEVGLGRQVVIKVLPPEMAAGVNQERFRREIQLAARLQHPHVVPLLTAGAAKDVLYYVMPYVEGESLRVKLSREGELPVADAVRILRDVTDALAYAHEKGVVHRDIKPDNVLLSRGHALVTDFGVAKAVSESATGTGALTSLGVALGTPAYMAPEQATGDPHTDHRADIYAVGALAYEMLAGRPPFVAPNAQALLAAQVTQAPDRLTQHRQSVPAALEAVVMRCLEKRAADRWQGAAELLPVLDSLLTPRSGTAPAPAVPLTISSGTETALRQAHPVRVAVLFALAALGVLSITWFLELRLGLPGWVLPLAGVLLLIGLPVMLLTASHERRRMLARATGEYRAPQNGLAGRLFTWRGALAGGVLALGGLAAGTGGFMALRASGVGPFATLVTSGKLNERDQLVLADFRNRTTDSTLGASITEALRIDLSQSPVVRVMEGSRVAATLRRMQQPVATLSEDLAREVAEREGAKAVVAGEVATLGSGYVLSARLISTGDSSTLLAVRETANDASTIIPAVERLSRKLREGIGESLRTIRAGQPLVDVTTTSLAALRAYSEGDRLFQQGDQIAAVPLMEQAVALDSTFGMAWRRLGVIESNLRRDPARMRAAFTRAFELRDRMPPHEAAHTEASYQGAVRADRAAAIRSYEGIIAKWPDDWIALNNLAINYQAAERFEDAERALRRIIELNPNIAFAYSNLIDAQVPQRKFAAAESTFATWGRTVPMAPIRLAYGEMLAREQRDWSRWKVYADSVTLVAKQGLALRRAHLRRWETLVLLGRVKEARQHLQQLIQFDKRAGSGPDRLDDAMSESGVEAFLLGHNEDAARLLDDVRRENPLDSVPPENRPYASLVAAYVVAGRVDRAQTLMAEYQRVLSSEIRTQGGEFPLAQAYMALARKDGAAALSNARLAQERFACLLCVTFEQARAFELLQQPDSAIIAYERIVNLPSMDNEERHLTYPAALRRLGELYDNKGDRKKALEYDGRLVDLWRDADPELQGVVRDVRRRMAELAGEPPRR